ncbi:MAG: OmpL47-type beta-barrel domain-containing protein, partial [Armatimonadaceae bacterium]
TTPVTATVAATDNSGGSGVKEIRYSVNMGAEQVVAGASATINLASEGVHTVAYWAVDIAGNAETTQYATVKIDKTAPAVAASLSNNTLTLTSTDSLSGVQWTKFRFDNGAEQTYTGPVTVPSTARTVSFRASDNAGNVLATQTIANGTLLKGIVLTPPGPVYAGTSVVVKVELFASAPTGGLVVALESSQLSVLPLPATLTVPAGALSVSTTVVIGPVPTDTGVQIEATLAGEWARAGLTVLVPTPKSVTLAPSLVSGGMTSVATVTLVSKAPAGGQVVSLESLDPSVASVPTSVTIPAGATSAKFTVTTFPVSSDRSVLIQAQADNTAAVAVLAVRRVVVSTLTLGAKSVTGGVSTTGTVALNRPAPSGGLTVVLSSTETAAG